MEAKEFHGPMYASVPNYYFNPQGYSKSLSLLVVPMQPNTSIYKIEKTIKGKAELVKYRK